MSLLSLLVLPLFLLVRNSLPTPPAPEANPSTDQPGHPPRSATYPRGRELLNTANSFIRELSADNKFIYQGWETSSFFSFEDGSYLVQQICTERDQPSRLPCVTKFHANGSQHYQRVWGEQGAVYSWVKSIKQNENMLYFAFNIVQGASQSGVILARFSPADGALVTVEHSGGNPLAITQIFIDNQGFYAVGSRGTDYVWWRLTLGLADQRARAYLGIGTHEVGRGVYQDLSSGVQYMLLTDPGNGDCKILKLGEISGDIIDYKKIDCGSSCSRGCFDIIPYGQDLMVLVGATRVFQSDKYYLLVIDTALSMIKSKYEITAKGNDLILLTKSNQTLLCLLDRFQPSPVLELWKLSGPTNALTAIAPRYTYSDVVSAGMRLAAVAPGVGSGLTLSFIETGKEKSAIALLDAFEPNSFTYCDISSIVSPTLSTTIRFFGLEALSFPVRENEGNFDPYSTVFQLSSSSYGLDSYEYCAPSVAPTAPSHSPTLPGATIPPTATSQQPTTTPTSKTALPTLPPTSKTGAPSKLTASPTHSPTQSPTLYIFDGAQPYLTLGDGKGQIVDTAFLGNKRVIWVDNQQKSGFYLVTNQTGYPIEAAELSLLSFKQFIPKKVIATATEPAGLALSLLAQQQGERLGCIAGIGGHGNLTYTHCFKAPIIHQLALLLDEQGQLIFSGDLKRGKEEFLFIGRYAPSQVTQLVNLTILHSLPHPLVRDHGIRRSRAGSYYGISQLRLLGERRQLIWFYGINERLEPLFNRYISSEKHSLGVKSYCLNEEGYVWILGVNLASSQERPIFLELLSRRRKGAIYELFIKKGKLELSAIAAGKNHSLFLAGSTNKVAAFGERALCILHYRKGFRTAWAYAYNTSLLKGSQVFLTTYGENLAIQATTKAGILNGFVSRGDGELGQHLKRAIEVRLINHTSSIDFAYYTDPYAELGKNQSLSLFPKNISLEKGKSQLQLGSSQKKKGKEQQQEFNTWEIVLISFGGFVGCLLSIGLVQLLIHWKQSRY